MHNISKLVHHVSPYRVKDLRPRVLVVIDDQQTKYLEDFTSGLMKQLRLSPEQVVLAVSPTEAWNQVEETVNPTQILVIHDVILEDKGNWEDTIRICQKRGWINDRSPLIIFFSTAEPEKLPKGTYYISARQRIANRDVETILRFLNRDRTVSLSESIIAREGSVDWDEILHLSLIQPFSLLKHRIDHIFLPTVIDLQGIGDELADEEKQPDEKERSKTAREYLKDVFDMRRDEQAYYCNRLNRARYLAVGHQDADTEKAFRLIGLEDVEEQALKTWIASGQPEAQLPEKKSMRDLVQRAFESQWERFIKLLGLCQVDDNTFKCNSASPIQQFMHKMDCLPKEYLKLPEPNVVLDFFKQSHDWGIEDMTIHSFGDWFSELADAMDKLRESLKPNLR